MQQLFFSSNYFLLFLTFRWGAHLAMVAPQEQREKVLMHSVDATVQLNKRQYAMLEVIGRSRHQGITQHTLSSYAHVEARSCFYDLRRLAAHNLITLQVCANYVEKSMGGGGGGTACFMQLSTPFNTALFSVQKSSQHQRLIHAERTRAARADAPWTPSTDWLSRCCEPWKRDRSSSTQLPRVALCCEPHVVTAAQKFGVESCMKRAVLRQSRCVRIPMEWKIGNLFE